MYAPAALDRLERERGLHIAHTYLETYHPPHTKFGLQEPARARRPARASRAAPGRSSWRPSSSDCWHRCRRGRSAARCGSRRWRTLADRLRAIADIKITRAAPITACWCRRRRRSPARRFVVARPDAAGARQRRAAAAACAASTARRPSGPTCPPATASSRSNERARLARRRRSTAARRRCARSAKTLRMRRGGSPSGSSVSLNGAPVHRAQRAARRAARTPRPRPRGSCAAAP